MPSFLAPYSKTIGAALGAICAVLTVIYGPDSPVTKIVAAVEPILMTFLFPANQTAV